MTIKLSHNVLRVIESEDRVEVWLDRPKVRNAINSEVIEDLGLIIADVEREPRFLIITGGVDGFFCAGADIREFRTRTAMQSFRGPNARLFQRLRKVPLPTVAAIDGYALGAGAELAVACDFRIATERAVFGQPEASFGVLSGAGGTWRLPALVGESMARQILLAGRRLDGNEALRHGLVEQVVEDPADLLTAANAYVDQLAKSSLLSLQLTKAALEMPPFSHPEFELIAQGLLYEAGDKDERIDAFFERRSDGSSPKDEGE